MHIKRQQLSIVLIISSLILLLVFQWLWLHNEYRSATFRMHGEASRVLMNSVREIRDSLFAEVIDKEFVFKKNDSSGVFVVTPDKLESKIDSFKLRRKMLSTNGDTPSLRNDSTLNIFLNSSRGRFFKDEGRPGSITGLLALTDEKFDDFVQTGELLKANNNLSELLKAYYNRGIKDRGLPETYDLLAISTDEEFPEGFRTRSYTDRISGRRYAMFYTNYEGYLLKQILPQIAFSLMLLVCISLAFFFIYQSLQKQRKLTQIKNDFISNVTHELKTPITTVGVAIEAMSSFNVLANPERTQEYLDISKHELNRLSILVDRVLKMALFEQSEPELKMQQLDLKKLTEGILDSMRLQFEKQQAEINFDAQGQDFFIKADRIHLTSVIYNLIDNALKYSPNNPEIDIVLEKLDKNYEISVKDKGMGIPKPYQDKIFDKFFRVPTGDKHNIKGHGLGLSYVASVIEKHKGNIKVQSEIGKGTTFRIFLPG